MKKPIMNIQQKFNQLHLPVPRKLLFPLMITFLLMGFSVLAQDDLPIAKVRFAHPQYDCKTHLYCLDVEVQSNTENQQLFGMNVRIFYDGDILQYKSMGDFAEGYSSPELPQIVAGPAGSGAFFGLPGPIVWFNGLVQLTDYSSVFISTTEWTKIFSMCFKVVDPSYLMYHPNFCPTIVWDLQENTENGGFFPGDDGVVITFLYSFPDLTTPTNENVEQFNWEYGATGQAYGHPVEEVCILTDCFIIPVANWAVYLGIGLMLIASVIIYRRRI